VSTSTKQDAAEHADQPAGPPTGWRLLVFRICRTISMALSCSYFPGKVEGLEHLPREGAYVLAPVHRSYVDWLIVARVTRRRMRYIGKDAVWHWAWLGRFLELLGGFPVHRGTADREALNRSIGALDGGEPLVLFPEGSRRSGQVVQPLLDGAAYLALRANVPIVPVGLGGTERRMPKGSHFPRPGRVKIVIGPPLLPDAGEHGGRVSRGATRRLSAELRMRIQECFDRAQLQLGYPVATPEQLTEAGIGATADAEAASSAGIASSKGTAPAGGPSDGTSAVAVSGHDALDEGD
jgi:1-acyl-sn-glycerol-3-phosphate acyltransferase